MAGRVYITKRDMAYKNILADMKLNGRPVFILSVETTGLDKFSDELINIVLNNGKNKPYKDCTMEERHQIEYVQLDFIGKKWYFNCNSQPLICKAEDISYGWKKLYCDTFFEKEIIRTLVNPLYRKWIKESLGYNIPELIWVEINNDICAVQYNNPRLREFRITPHAEVKDAWLPYIIYVD